MEERFKKFNEKYVVAFLDILGFGNYVKGLNDENKIKGIINFLNILKKLEKPYKEESNSGFTIKLGYVNFSDSVIVYAPINLESPILNSILNLLFVNVGFIQAATLESFGLPIRGGISTGRFYDENIFFGDGLVNAYELESKEAKHPRVIIDKNLEDYIKNTTVKKEDDYYVIDFLMTCIPEDCPGQRKSTLKRIQSNIIINKEKYKNFVELPSTIGKPKISTYDKWDYLHKYFDDFVKDRSLSDDFEIKTTF